MITELVKTVKPIKEYSEVKSFTEKLDSMKKSITDLESEIESSQISLIGGNKKLDGIMVANELGNASQNDVENQETLVEQLKEKIKKQKRELKAKRIAAGIIEGDLSIVIDVSKQKRLAELKTTLENVKQEFEKKYPSVIDDMKAIMELEILYIKENDNKPFPMGLVYSHEYPRCIELLPLLLKDFDLKKYERLSFKFAPYKSPII